MKKKTKVLITSIAIACVVIISLVAFYLRTRYMNSHWQEYILKGMSKSEVERILPVKKEIPGPMTGGRTIGNYELSDGSIFYYDYRNGGYGVLGDALREYDIINWRLDTYHLQKAGTKEIKQMINANKEGDQESSSVVRQEEK